MSVKNTRSTTMTMKKYILEDEEEETKLNREEQYISRGIEGML